MGSLVDNVKLSEEFLNQYIGKQPKWGFGGLGFIIYLRTYARKKADGTLESWWETCRRVTEGNFRIEARRLQELNKLTPERLAQMIAEMERFYHLFFNLVFTPPGRGLWMSGTEYAEKVGDAENNCWLVVMRPQPFTVGGEPKVSFAPAFTFDMAMKGGGVGVNIQRKNVNQIPSVKNRLDLKFIVRADHPDVKELEALGVDAYELHEVIFLEDGSEIKFTDGSVRAYTRTKDSREGWVDNLSEVIDSHYEYKQYLVIDLSDVRERDADIKGFGGKASGPAPLVDCLTKINKILNDRVGRYVTPTQWGDVIQLIGTCVVAGNVRRTALILMGDEDDQEYVQSKNYSLEQNLAASQWRWASNNSVDITAETQRDVLRNLAANIYYNGEPGYVNIGLSRNYGRIIDGYMEGIDAEVEGFNPCGEITLPNGSPCNLFEINMPRIHELVVAGVESESLYEEAMYLGVRYAYRITFRPYEWEITRNIVTRHRRLGVGITGITDWSLLKFGEPSIIGFDEKGDPIYNANVTSHLDKIYGFGKKYNVEQAADLAASPSIKITTVKPSGTVSLLMGCSPGQHFHWSAYMIRRVRMSATAPLVPVLMECGYYIEPAVRGYNEKGETQYDYNTVVVEFPVKAPTADHPKFQSAGDVPLKEQAAIQSMLATYWSDNAVSATLSFHKAQPKPVYFDDGTVLLDKFGNPDLKVDKRDDEHVIEEITDILDKYKGVIKSTSLLPYATGTYAQMPYESITKEKYDSMVAKIKAKPWELLNGNIQAEDEDTTDYSSECVGGSCPLK